MTVPDDVEAVPTIILCGGRGTRIAEAYPRIPKPMVPIGDQPVLWHIMKLYASQGFGDFVLALGWLGDRIRRWVLDYRALNADFTVDFGDPDSIRFLTEHGEHDWRITCRETGHDSLTGTRVLQAAAHLDAGTLMVTYGDGLADVDLQALLASHRRSGKLATITAVRPPGRFGELVLDDDQGVTEFAEKPQSTVGVINGGFMVFQREAIERYVPDSDVMLEEEPLAKLAADGELHAYIHEGFWQCMDTARERDELDGLWASRRAPWKRWT